ncbi:class IIb bacteriocin, lactobin A/cerein 7B family [Chryseobacterium nematophagum]|uniref:Class IIb bacteriocin, lactobin A/cerein 7B family n=1 Tax=Chryseobacterium nematophagum TaxID=2305228 RepID=A0A3M7THS9_9FLAO|nr:class IIb bacteriocin, lactobin A/cerein 7B family [Chryseobacterium nematophagum]RNA62838.1 class IIb bacteriocin, lactobin A/cerein 7B family [Chryseobacterium nematophagum]
MQIENLKVKELSSQEAQNIGGGFWPVIFGAIGLGLLGGAVSAAVNWGTTYFYNNYY